MRAERRRQGAPLCPPIHQTHVRHGRREARPQGRPEHRRAQGGGVHAVPRVQQDSPVARLQGGGHGARRAGARVRHLPDQGGRIEEGTVEGGHGGLGERGVRRGGGESRKAERGGGRGCGRERGGGGAAANVCDWARPAPVLTGDPRARAGRARSGGQCLCDLWPGARGAEGRTGGAEGLLPRREGKRVWRGQPGPHSLNPPPPPPPPRRAHLPCLCFRRPLSLPPCPPSLPSPA